MQQQIRTRAAIRLLATTKQSPTGPSSTTSYEDQTGEELLADSTEKVIAPSESYKKKDEHQLEHQQQHRQTEENKEATSPTHKMSDTAVRNNDHLKTTYSAVTPSGLDEEDLPQTSQQYASDIDDATRRPESTKNQTLYDTTASLKRLIVSARGGIFDTHGDPEMDLDHSQGEPKPNSQVLPYNGSVIEADRLGTENDPLT